MRKVCNHPDLITGQHDGALLEPNPRVACCRACGGGAARAVARRFPGAALGARRRPPHQGAARASTQVAHPCPPPQPPHVCHPVPPLLAGSLFFPGPEELVRDCGKMALLDRLLARLLPAGHKVLIFSQVGALGRMVTFFCWGLACGRGARATRSSSSRRRARGLVAAQRSVASRARRRGLPPARVGSARARRPSHPPTYLPTHCPQMTSMLDLISVYLEAREVEHCRIDGSISWQARARAPRGGGRVPAAGSPCTRSQRRRRVPCPALRPDRACPSPALPAPQCVALQDRQESMKRFNTEPECKVGGCREWESGTGGRGVAVVSGPPDAPARAWLQGRPQPRPPVTPLRQPAPCPRPAAAGVPAVHARGRAGHQPHRRRHLHHL